ncbi:HAL/PAL/TAL family ammonia-lyase [Halocatena salina]|uniref:Aromatic amino acid ammonia-lyase n=1 Tax=Halocatena salina TaxID=2934340 RepID=A0A8U0A9J3_9EURY|nr:aromatic amino acid ammonia-lyase [Halocatena salina]UPM44517.1 aromatic amino acid ammonia-lyase [Halocatena salina]
MSIRLGPKQELGIEEIHQLGKSGTTVELTDAATQAIEESYEHVGDWLDEGRVIYGITTGVGELLHNIVPPDQSREMSHNICQSHAVGVGDRLDKAMVRRMMGVRLHTFAQGHSGVQLALTKLLQELINRNITPVVPEQGTVSASGDLNPLAHIGTVLTGDGDVLYEGETMDAAEAFDHEGLDPITLEPKEGLSCMNGTTATTPMSAMALREANHVLKTSLLATALSMEVLHASAEPFDPDVLAIRPHPGMLRVGTILRDILEDSDLIRQKEVIQVEFDELLNEDESVHTDAFRQDSYSLRGIPQIIGPTLESYHFCKDTVETELNSVDDNPVVIPEEDQCLHSAQFHAQSLAHSMDVLKLSLAEVGVICERQAARLLDPAVSKGLPPFLAPDELSCGYEGAQYVAGSMIAENRVLASPVSIQSLSLNGQFQDVVSMGLIAARQARTIIEHVRRVLDFELMAAAQAAEIRGPDHLSPVSQTVYETIRDEIPPVTEDRQLTGDFDRMEALTKGGELVRMVENTHGAEQLSLAFPEA